MFKANTQNLYVPSKSQSVKPDVVSDVLPLDQIRLLIPSFVQFVDPTSTYLKFDLVMENARGIVVPDPKGGIHSLFRNVILRDGANQATLESLEEYSSQACMTRPFTKQDSIDHKRELFEGVQHLANRDGGSLYYAPPQSLNGATSRQTANTQPRQANTIQIYSQLNTGLFKGGVLPVALMQGLRLQIDTEDSLRALVDLGRSAGSEEAGFGQMASPDAGTNGGNINQGGIGTRDGATVANNLGGLTLDVVTSNAGEGNNFAIGDRVYANHDGGAGGDNPANYTNEILLGVVGGFFVSGGNRLGLQIILQSANNAAVPANANYTAANNTRIYYKMADRQVAMNTFSAGNLTNNADLVIPAPSYRISNLEMLCQSVTPPPAYVEGMLKKAMSSQGVSIDYLTSELHRFNQVNTLGVSQVQIPTLARRAKAVFVQPVPVQNDRTLQTSSFAGQANNAANYQFVKGSELIPSRRADLARYSQAVAGTSARRSEPLHVSELQKALTNIGSQVYSLQNIHDNFVIARSFNKYGQITDLSDETLSLRVDYQPAGVQNTFNCYVYKLNRVTIQQGQVMVM
tara:strand:+ start:475 stop:2193 length:1719 start_codon:yes stop_codon:yes gene_type:complete